MVKNNELEEICIIAGWVAASLAVCFIFSFLAFGTNELLLL
jgi:hypothetical protein